LGPASPGPTIRGCSPAEVPDIEVHHLETPAPAIPGGFKGAGEGGTAGAPAAILNAVNDTRARSA